MSKWLWCFIYIIIKFIVFCYIRWFAGSITAWNSSYDKVREYTEPDGLESLQAAQDFLAPIDQELREGDLIGALKLARECIHRPVATQGRSNPVAALHNF